MMMRMVVVDMADLAFRREPTAPQGMGLVTTIRMCT